MDLISGLQTFIRVIETGSFSAVARESNTSQSAVTRHIAQLEEHFGVRLFHRTTRKLSLTDDGQDLEARARHLLEVATDLEDTVGRARGAPTGLVRVGMPVGAAMLLMPDFGPLLRRYPNLAIELVVEDRIDDLVAERLDVGLRFGQSPDASMMSRAIATLGAAPVAAPAYLERHGAPAHPPELANHTCIISAAGNGSAHWAFIGRSGPVEVEVTGPLRSDNLLVVRRAALSGHGVAMLADALIINDIRESRLYRLLPDYTTARRQVFVVYPSRRHLPPRTRVVIDFLIDRFKDVEDRLQNERAWGESDATWLV